MRWIIVLVSLLIANLTDRSFRYTFAKPIIEEVCHLVSIQVRLIDKYATEGLLHGRCNAATTTDAICSWGWYFELLTDSLDGAHANKAAEGTNLVSNSFRTNF